MNYNISSFEWGISQDDVFVWKWQSVFQQGIDTINFPSELRLMPEIQDEWWGIWEWARSFMTAESNVWFGSDDWKVNDLATGALKISTGDTRDVIDWILFKGNFYIFSRKYVYKTTYTSGALSALSTIVTHSAEIWYNHPVIYGGNEMYFPSGKQVKYVDEFGNVNTLPQTFSSNVRALSISGNTLRIYTETTLAILDVGTKTVSYSQILPFVTTWLATDGIIDYVTTEWEEMYICSWLEWRKLAQMNSSDTVGEYTTSTIKMNFKSSIDWRALTYSDWILFAIERTTWRVLMYGSKMQGLPSQFQYLPKHDASLETIESYKCILAKNNFVYLSYSTDSREEVTGTMQYDWFGTWNCLEWIYITPPTDLGDYSIIKSIEEIRVWKVGTAWELWALIDNDSFVKIGNLDQTDIEQKFMDYKKDFREISFMVKLNSSVDRLYNIYLRYNQRTV